eukprot:SAG22_NODE_48_length_24654_cov_4.406394_3_plen_170_part_00
MPLTWEGHSGPVQQPLSNSLVSASWTKHKRTQQSFFNVEEVEFKWESAGALPVYFSGPNRQPWAPALRMYCLLNSTGVCPGLAVVPIGEWNGMEWNGMEWNGMEWNGMEWNGRPGGAGHLAHRGRQGQQGQVQRLELLLRLELALLPDGRWAVRVRRPARQGGAGAGEK